MSALASRLVWLSKAAAVSPARMDSGAQSALLTLRYDRPTEAWNEALPLGNGRLGAMVFGRVDCERIQMNEATLWTGKPHDYANPDARKNLAQVRSLIFEEKVEAAEALAGTLLGTPSQLQAYQPFCDLHLDLYTDTHTDEYERTLDLARALSGVKYRCGDIVYERTCFASFPDQVFVLRSSSR
jgi:alpha-L-fucosidase 2